MNNRDSLEHLIDQAVGGDRAATAQLLASYASRLMRRLTMRLELNPFADFCADDVLQEVFMDVFRGIGTFQPERGGAFSAWLDRVADNRLATFLRDRSRLKRGGAVWCVDLPDGSGVRLLDDLRDPDSATASDRLTTKEAKQAVMLCVASLPDGQRECVERYYLQQQELAEIAKSLGTTKEAVRSLLYRAKQSMRSMLGSSSRWFRKK